VDRQEHSWHSLSFSDQLVADETMAGAPKGNQNAHNGSLVRGAIRRALAENEAKGRDSLNNIVRKMIDDAETGDREARREFFDRLDGKAVAKTEIEANVEARVSGLGPVYGVHPTPEA
jgi:hypothetical protein